jgi:hypothetical protein
MPMRCSIHTISILSRQTILFDAIVAPSLQNDQKKLARLKAQTAQINDATFE